MTAYYLLLTAYYARLLAPVGSGLWPGAGCAAMPFISYDPDSYVAIVDREGHAEALTSYFDTHQDHPNWIRAERTSVSRYADSKKDLKRQTDSWIRGWIKTVKN